MKHTKQVYTFSKSSKIVCKSDGEKRVNVSTKMFIEELIDLCDRDIFLSGTKIRCTHKKRIIYLFDANQKNKMYNAHNVSNVTIKIDYKNIDVNVDNINVLDSITNDVKNVTTYSTCTELFEMGTAKGFIVNGFSLGTYSSPKLSIGLSKSINNDYNPNSVIYNPSNINNFIIFDGDSQNTFSESPTLEKQYVYKN